MGESSGDSCFILRFLSKSWTHLQQVDERAAANMIVRVFGLCGNILLVCDSRISMFSVRQQFPRQIGQWFWHRRVTDILESAYNIILNVAIKLKFFFNDFKILK